MNKPILLLSVLLLGFTGCTYNYGVAGQCCGPGHLPHTGYSVVNNSGVSLDIYQDGIRVAQNIGPGDVLPIRPIVFQQKSSVIAVGHDANGAYTGTDHWTFLSGLPEVWSVGKLYQPGTTPPVWMQ